MTKKAPRLSPSKLLRLILNVTSKPAANGTVML